MLKRVVTVVQAIAVLAAAAFVVLLFRGDSPPEIAVLTGDPEAPASPGAALYTGHCASCHGDEGEGGLGPRLGGGAVVQRFPDPEAQATLVADGRRNMPAFGETLSPDEIDAVVAYTRDDL